MSDGCCGYSRTDSSNIADPFSRLGIVTKEKTFDECDEQIFIQAIVECVAVNVTEIKKALEEDQQLSVVKEAVETDDWESSTVAEFAKEYKPSSES